MKKLIRKALPGKGFKEVVMKGTTNGGKERAKSSSTRTNPCRICGANCLDIWMNSS